MADEEAADPNISTPITTVVGDPQAQQETCGPNDSPKPQCSDGQESEGSVKKSHVIGKQKIDLLLKATGDAPIMKQKKWTVEADRKIGSITVFIKKYLKLEPSESLFLYVNQAFAPSPDQLLKNLYECFGTDGKLVLHYCKTQAWG